MPSSPYAQILTQSSDKNTNHAIRNSKEGENISAEEFPEGQCLRTCFQLELGFSSIYSYYLGDLDKFFNLSSSFLSHKRGSVAAYLLQD